MSNPTTEPLHGFKAPAFFKRVRPHVYDYVTVVDGVAYRTDFGTEVACPATGVPDGVYTLYPDLTLGATEEKIADMPLYMLLRDLEVLARVEVDMADMAWALGAASTDPSRPPLMGVLLGGDVLVATDGRQLRLVRTDGAPIDEIIFPSSAAPFLPKDGAVEIEILEYPRPEKPKADEPEAADAEPSPPSKLRLVRWTSGGCVVVAKTIDAAFPNYKQVLGDPREPVELPIAALQQELAITTCKRHKAEREIPPIRVDKSVATRVESSPEKGRYYTIIMPLGDGHDEDGKVPMLLAARLVAALKAPDDARVCVENDAFRGVTIAPIHVTWTPRTTAARKRGPGRDDAIAKARKAIADALLRGASAQQLHKMIDDADAASSIFASLFA